MTGKSSGILTAHAATISVEARQSAVVVPTSAARMVRALRSIFASHYWEELGIRGAKKGTYTAAIGAPKFANAVNELLKALSEGAARFTEDRAERLRDRSGRGLAAGEVFAGSDIVAVAADGTARLWRKQKGPTNKRFARRSSTKFSLAAKRRSRCFRLIRDLEKW